MIMAGAIQPGGVYRVDRVAREYVVDSITVLPSGLVSIEWSWLTPEGVTMHRSWTGDATGYFADTHVNYVITEDAVLG